MPAKSQSVPKRHASRLLFSASMMPQPCTRSTALDVVRGVAILLVMAFHLFRLPFGWTGVDLFFVLSGYLIGGILIDNRHARGYYTTFYARRAFRILPLYLVFLAAAAASTGLDLPLWRYLTFTQNFAWIEGGLIGAGLTGLTWSLAVEEQFYLLLPAVVRMFSNKGLMVLSGGIICAGPLVRWTMAATISPASPYLLLPGRMDLLFTGVLAATLARDPACWAAIRERVPMLAGVAAVAFSAFLLLGTLKGFQPAAMPMYIAGFSLTAIAYGCGLLVVVAREQLVSRYRLLSLIGVGAYSLYLFHQYVWWQVWSAVGIIGAGHVGGPLGMTATAATAIACWIVIERPMIQFAKVRWRYGRSEFGDWHPGVPGAIS
jgi:peptidoglycan/LPS O-acetylase OafA/YrhL